MTSHCHDASCHTHLADVANHASALPSGAEFLIFTACMVVLLIAFGIAWEPFQAWVHRREHAKRQAEFARRLDADMRAFWERYENNRRR
jgi:hypothetical protein